MGAAARAIACRFWSVRAVAEDIAEAPTRCFDCGLMVTVVDHGGIGHAASSGLGEDGLRRAFARAQALAHIMAGRGVFDFDRVAMPSPRGHYRGPQRKPLPATLAQVEDLALHYPTRVVLSGVLGKPSF